MRTRRFWRPFFSILVTATLPISPVAATWVPPQGWRSTVPMRTRRTRPDPRGGFTLVLPAHLSDLTGERPEGRLQQFAKVVEKTLRMEAR